MTYIGFRDSIGLLEVELDIACGITFSDGKAYFSDTDGQDYTVQTKDLVYIEER